MNKIITCLKNNKVKILAIITILSTIIYILGNFDNMLLYDYIGHWNDLNYDSPWIKYQYWLEDVFGQEKGMNISFKLKYISWWFVEHHRNLMLLVIITMMMLISLIADKIKRKKFNWILAIYYVICFVVMCFITFYASPSFAEYYF